MAVMLRIFCIVVICLYFFSGSYSEYTREIIFKNGPCLKYEFACNNNKCISREKWCNGIYDCDDRSDENYCRTGNSCPSHAPFMRFRTDDYYLFRCVPLSWKCDDIKDTIKGEDESDSICDLKDAELLSRQVMRSRKKADNSILKLRRGERSIPKWGTNAPRIAVALYLSNYFTSAAGRNSADELAYELNINFLSKLALKKIEDVLTHDIALYVNAFLVTCVDPRKFHEIDLVDLLRKRVDTENSTNPFALLVLCNAQDLITERDIKMLNETFWIASGEFRTDTQALVILALSCASQQPEHIIELKELSEFTKEFKTLQYPNGTIENLKTTALVMQAIFATEPEPDLNVLEEKAIRQIIQLQESNGSFGDIVHTYYVLPVLSYTSLVNISSSHCPAIPKKKFDILQFLRDQVGVKWKIQYSLWFGDDKVVQKTLSVSVSANTSFYGIMEYAADLDEKYRFEYNMRDGKPYIYVLSGLMDDPEMEMFWVPYFLKKESAQGLKLITKSPADIIPENNDHLVFWYQRRASKAI